MRQQQKADHHATDQVADHDLQETEVGVVGEAGDADDRQRACLRCHNRERDRPPRNIPVSQKVVAERPLLLAELQSEDRDPDQVRDNQNEVESVQTRRVQTQKELLGFVYHTGFIDGAAAEPSASPCGTLRRNCCAASAVRRTSRNSCTRGTPGNFADQFAPTASLTLPTPRIGSLSDFITRSNAGRSSDCAPSLSARSGHGCTSMISPSAPTAIAARDTGAIKLGRPVPCD